MVLLRLDVLYRCGFVEQGRFGKLVKNILTESFCWWNGDVCQGRHFPGHNMHLGEQDAPWVHRLSRVHRGINAMG